MKPQKPEPPCKRILAHCDDPLVNIELELKGDGASFPIVYESAHEYEFPEDPWYKLTVKEDGTAEIARQKFGGTVTWEAGNLAPGSFDIFPCNLVWDNMVSQVHIDCHCGESSTRSSDSIEVHNNTDDPTIIVTSSSGNGGGGGGGGGGNVPDYSNPDVPWVEPPPPGWGKWWWRMWWADGIKPEHIGSVLWLHFDANDKNLHSWTVECTSSTVYHDAPSEGYITIVHGFSISKNGSDGHLDRFQIIVEGNTATDQWTGMISLSGRLGSNTQIDYEHHVENLEDLNFSDNHEPIIIDEYASSVGHVRLLLGILDPDDPFIVDPFWPR